VTVDGSEPFGWNGDIEFERPDKRGDEPWDQDNRSLSSPPTAVSGASIPNALAGNAANEDIEFVGYFDVTKHPTEPKATVRRRHARHPALRQ
jgi:hypothetical protein